ncbi:hypothetical protein [Streptodolium elevatio]
MQLPPQLQAEPDLHPQPHVDGQLQPGVGADPGLRVPAARTGVTSMYVRGPGGAGVGQGVDADADVDVDGVIDAVRESAGVPVMALVSRSGMNDLRSPGWTNALPVALPRRSAHRPYPSQPTTHPPVNGQNPANATSGDIRPN